MQPRLLQKPLRQRLAETPKSLMLLGARQTGKSTLFRQLSPDLTIDLADEGTYRDHLKDASLLKAQCAVLSGSAKVLLDEVQRIPAILNTVQSLVDSKPGLQFLITGSSARKLKRGQANLLPGRLFWYKLFPLTFWELADVWNLEKALTIGTLPEIYLKDYGPDLLSNYIDTYLREEVQAEALTRNLDSYARFLDIAAENSGLITNYSQLSSDSEIPKETIRRFYDILADTLLVHRLPGFTKIKGHRKATQKEMFIFFDMGVRNAVLKQHKNVFTPTQLGKLFEQWVITQFIAYSSYHQKDWEFFFYRDDLKQEVDLIIECRECVLAIEIKYATKYKPEFIRHLKEFEKLPTKPTHSFLIYRGETVQQRDGVSVYPYEKFFNEKIKELDY
jgi:uncharacterized protein